MAVAVDDELSSRSVARRNFLLDADNAPGCGDLQRACIRIQAAFQKSEKGGLAGAVLADDAHALTRVHHEVGAIQQDLGPAPKNDSCCADHGCSCSRVRSRIWSSLLAVLSHTGSSSGKEIGRASCREGGEAGG